MLCFFILLSSYLLQINRSVIVIDFFLSNLQIPSSKFMVYVICSKETKHRSDRFINRWRSQNFSFSDPVFLPNDISDISHISNVTSLIDFDNYLVDYNTYPVNAYPRMHLLLIIKYLNAIKHFLEKTQAEYIIRITDDVYINFHALPEFLIELDEIIAGRERNILILGNCIDYFQILQGGSGFLLSREAAKVMYNTYHEFLHTVNKPEDWVLSYHFLKINPDITKTRSPRFIGHGFKYMSIPYRNHGKCPSVLKNKSCGRGFYPIKKVVFFHQIKHLVSINFWEEKLKLFPSDLMWYEKNSFTYLCYLK